jgi:hypothetical protein
MPNFTKIHSRIQKKRSLSESLVISPVWAVFSISTQTSHVGTSVASLWTTVPSLTARQQSMSPSVSCTCRSRPARSLQVIVWSISICASLTCWVLEFAFHESLSPEYAPVGKLNRSNRFRACDWRRKYRLVNKYMSRPHALRCKVCLSWQYISTMSSLRKTQ